MSAEILTIAVGMILTWLIFTWAIKVLKASVSTALMIAIVFFMVHIFFGIDYQQIWQDLDRLVRQFIDNL